MPAAPFPPARTPLADPLRLPVAFAHVLRRWGLRVPVGRLPLYASALGAVGVATRSSVYWAGRATLVNRPEDIAAYDGAFAQFWEGGPPPVARLAVATPVVVEAPDTGDTGPAPGQDPERNERTEV